MATEMSNTDRVLTALKGGDVDRVPVSAWWHDYIREWSAEKLAEMTLEAYRRYGWDYIKVNPRASYYSEAWGARFNRNVNRQPDMAAPGISSLEDLRRIEPVDITSGPFGEQLDSLRLIARELKGEAPFIQTVFSPLAVLSRTTGSTKYVQRLMRENPDDVLRALDVVTETLATYSRACLDAGASGIFFPTLEWGSADHISTDDYARFARPYDLRVLEAVRGAAFNVFHVCRNRNHLADLLDYPVAAFHWDVRGEGNPSFREIAGRTVCALMGGVSHDRTMAGDDPQAVTNEASEAIAETGGRRFLLSPGCSIEPTTPEANLRALVEAARS